MAEIIDARVKQKTGTAADFAGYTLLEGEIALVRTSASGPVWNFKVGPGNFDSLDWSLQNPGAAQKADTSTVFPVGVPGLYIPTEDGTYEGVTVDLSVGYVQLIWDGSSLVKAEFPIDLAGYVANGDINKTSGKNLFDIGSMVEDDAYISSSNGSLNNSTGFKRTVTIDITGLTDIAVSGIELPTVGVPFRFEDSGGNLVGGEFGVISSVPWTSGVPVGAVGFRMGLERAESNQPKNGYNDLQVESGTVATPFQPYYDAVDKVLDTQLIASYVKGAAAVIEPQNGENNVVTHGQLNGKGYGIPDVDQSVNLQNPGNSLNDVYIDSSNGNKITLSGAVSYFMAVTGSTDYTISGYTHPNWALNRTLAMRFEDVSGTRLSFIVLEENSPTTFTTPAGCTKIIYSVYRTSDPQDYSKIQVELGAVAHPYEPYSDTAFVTGINGIPIKPSGDASVVVDVASSDIITILGDSYTDSYYTLPDKAYISRLSEQLAYQFRNFGRSGDDAIEEIIRVVNDAAPFTATGLGIKQHGSKYAIISLYANDSVYRYWSMDMFKENIRELILRVMDLGYKPIIATEFFLYSFTLPNPGVNDPAILQELADEYGCIFIDIANISQNFIVNREPDFWNGTHPATRTNSVMWRPMLDVLRSLPRPTQGVKIWRARTTAGPADLLFLDHYDKIKKWKEISVGHTALAPASYHLFDRMTQSLTYAAVHDEYLKLQNGEALSVNESMLLEFTLPYTSKDVDTLQLTFDTEDSVTVYALKKRSPFASTKSFAFRFTGGAPTINQGDEYTVSSGNANINGITVTARNIRYGYVIMDGVDFNYPPPTASGTLTIDSGTGTGSIAFDAVQASFVEEYYDEYDDSKYALQEITPSNGVYYVDNTARQFVEYDTVRFIVYASGGFDISNPKVTVPKKNSNKVYSSPSTLNKSANGSELLAENFTSNLSNWTTEGSVSVVQPIGNANPRGASGGVVLDGTNAISQAINYVDEHKSIPVQIKIWASYEPAKFTGTDIATSPITLNSFDYSELHVIINGGGNETKFVRYVGMGVQEITINTALSQGLVNPKIRLESATGNEVLVFKVMLRILN